VCPIYETLKGWQRPVRGLTRLEDLPDEAREYIKFIENYVDCRISLISTGASREETINLFS